MCSHSNTSASPKGTPRLSFVERVGGSELPVDLQARIVPGDRALELRIIEVCGFVQYVSTLRRHAKPKSEPQRDAMRVPLKFKISTLLVPFNLRLISRLRSLREYRTLTEEEENY
jgi:hypothetical protein